MKWRRRQNRHALRRRIVELERELGVKRHELAIERGEYPRKMVACLPELMLGPWGREWN